MKKILGIITFTLACSISLNAQSTDKNTTNQKSEIAKPARDFFMLQIGYDGWNQVTEPNVELGGLSRSFAAYLNYDFLLGKKETSNFSFAVGVGISNSNFSLLNTRASLNEPSPSIMFRDIDSTYKSSKLRMTYIEAPLELRYFGNKINRNKGFKAAVGVRIGYLASTRAKFKHNVDGNWITMKEGNSRFTNQWKFAPTVRIGWGNVSIYGSYSLTALFKDTYGPEVYPYSIGLCISGL